MATKKPVLAVAGVPRVNLLPRIEIERRERASLTRTWGIFCGIAVLVVLTIVAATLFLKFAADQRLAAENAKTTELLGQIAGYSDVSRTTAQRLALENFRAEAMASDFAWTPLFDEIEERLPKDVEVLEWTLTPGLAPAGDDPAAQIGATGILTFLTGDARLQAETVAALSEMPGMMVVDAGSLYAAGEKDFEFAITVTLDQTIYSGDFSKDGE